MKNKDSLQNPWAGLSSYEDPANSDRQLKFCGRDSNTYDVTRLIDDNFMVTLYGKSGIGKTSLLNAGVFPALRQEQYTPLSLRLGLAEESAVYQDIITTAIEFAIIEKGGSVSVVNVVEEQLDPSAIDYLWNWFARHRFVNAEGEITFPVIVFDQFEESFRQKESRKKTEILLRQLHYLIDESHELNDCIVDGEEYFYDFNFRFVLSIREDDLYRLEDSIDNNSLGSLKQCRYRLRSLSEQGARDVILIPGKGLFQPDEQEQIVGTIISISRNPEDNSISTNLLSLVCNRIFVDFLRKKDVEYISSSLVDTFIKGNPFERFYNEATRGFSNREKNYIEDHFVDSTGRRNSVPESDFLFHVKRGATLLEGNTRILQRTSTSSDSSSYRIELIHDSFCAPLAEMKAKREKRRRLYDLALMTTILLISIATIAFILNQNHHIENQAAKLLAYNQQLRDDSLQAVTHIRQIEKQKKVAEDAKTQAEELKAIAEKEKARAEKQRAIAEKEKARAEELKAIAEKQRAIAEKQRAIAEKEKARAEEQRAIAEKEKARAEKQRAIAEKEKAIAEEQRAIAEKEKARAEKYAEKLKFLQSNLEGLDSIIELKPIILELDQDLEKVLAITNEKVEKTSSGYIVDEIEYQYEKPTKGQITNWAKKYHQICAQKIKSQMESYDISYGMVEEDPCLVYLILNSQSIEEKSEKQSWFDLWSLMNKDQKNELCGILYRETYKLANIEYKIKNGSNDPEELNNMAYVYARSKEWDNAISTIDKAIKLNPNEANYYDSKGEILMMMGDEQNALKMWHKVMELDPNFLHKHNGSTPLYEQLKKSGSVN